MYLYMRYVCFYLLYLQIEGVYVTSERQGKVLEIEDKKHFCPLCPHKLGCVVKYTVSALLIWDKFGETYINTNDNVTKMCRRGFIHCSTLHFVHAGCVSHKSVREARWRSNSTACNRVM